MVLISLKTGDSVGMAIVKFETAFHFKHHPFQSAFRYILILCTSQEHFRMSDSVTFR